MTINNWEQYKANLWDWAILDGCFGVSKISPTDIDGFVERNGRFLVIETKAPTAEVEQGQEIVFRELVKTGKFTVFVVWGKPGQPERMRIISIWADQAIDADLDKLREKTKMWYKYANGS